MKPIPNGAIAYKCNSEPGDGHQDGEECTILANTGDPVEFKGQLIYGYFVKWKDFPAAVFIAGHRLTTERERSERE